MADAANLEIANSNDADRSFDFSLRLLTALVVIALAGSVSLLFYRWLAPSFSPSGAGTVARSTARPQSAPAATVVGPTRGAEVLMDPGRVFRCEEQGRVSFSDQACGSSGAASR